MLRTKVAPILIASSLLIIISMSSTANAQDQTLLGREFIGNTLGMRCPSLIAGLVQCPLPPPNRPGESPLPEGIDVTVTCGGQRATIMNFLGDPKGSFKVLVEFPFKTLSDPSSNRDCRIVFRTTSAACGAFPAEFLAEMRPVDSATPQLVSPDCPSLQRFEAGEFRRVDHYPHY